MKNYLVCTMSKDTGEVNFKHIEAESPKSVIIEEYIDSMGYVIWAVYPPSVSYEEATTDFARYTRHYFENCQ